jgi:lipopolysaccharide biosynthesis regulator YciM
MGATVLAIGQIDITLSHALIGLGLALLGLLLGFLIFRSSGEAKQETKSAKKNKGKGRLALDDAFLKGLAHLMADHTDKAIEEFTRAVDLDSDTVETYVVLGNLFRQKGEIERAVRIRQNIVARPNLDPEIKIQAMFDLGLDYKKGGLLNRATDLFAEVLAMEPEHVDACRQMVSLYEETRDWEKAFETLKRLDRLTGSDHSKVLAHYKTERAKELMAEGQIEQAEGFLNQAKKEDKSCLDAYLHLGDLEMLKNRPKKALNIWRKATDLVPGYTDLIIERVAEAEDQIGSKAMKNFLAELDHSKMGSLALVALARHYNNHSEDLKALELLAKAIGQSKGNLAAHRLRGEILLAKGPKEQALIAYEELLTQLNGNTVAYQCSQCGHLSHELTWKCPRCQKWDTLGPRHM